jgi:hypothetical protein
MKLKPLQQWICDTCHGLIESPQDGFLEWLLDDDQQRRLDFRIVHRKSKSPRRTAEGCYQHGKASNNQDMNLDAFINADGLGYLLSFLHPDAKATRELGELIRRLHLPLYEEARMHWPAAERDGFFAGANETPPFRQDTLTKIVKRYST